jgi:hypothetical protein
MSGASASGFRLGLTPLGRELFIRLGRIFRESIFDASNFGKPAPPNAAASTPRRSNRTDAALAQQREAPRRRAEGATLEELAKSYNVARATISRLGDRSPRRSKLKLAPEF